MDTALTHEAADEGVHQPCARHAGVDEPIGVQLHRGLGGSIGVDVCAGFTHSCHGGCRAPFAPNGPRGCPFAVGLVLAGAPWAPPLLRLAVPCACCSWVTAPRRACPRRCRQHPESLHDDLAHCLTASPALLCTGGCLPGPAGITVCTASCTERSDTIDLLMQRTYSSPWWCTGSVGEMHGQSTTPQVDAAGQHMIAGLCCQMQGQAQMLQLL